MDQDNPWIVLLKAWIYALSNNPWIVRSIRGSPRLKGAKHGFGQSTWTKCGFAIAVATTEWRVHGFHEKSVAILTRKVDLSVIENDDRKHLKTYKHSLQNHVAILFFKTALGIFLHFL